MSILHNYTILKPIGEGTFGKVKRNSNLVATHKLTGQRVAIKYIKKSAAKGMGIEKNICREVKISKRFSHPNIVKM